MQKSLILRRDLLRAAKAESQVLVNLTGRLIVD